MKLPITKRKAWFYSSLGFVLLAGDFITLSRLAFVFLKMKIVEASRSLFL